MGIDDRLGDELSRLAPADPSGAYEKVLEKRLRRRILRKAQAVSLTVAVIAGTIGGVWGLAKVFRPEPSRIAAGATNGRIAFSDYRFDPACGGDHDFCGWRIYSMNPDGSDVREIGPEGIYEALEPSYSPDGTRIAFHGWDGRDDGIYVMNADGSAVTKLLSTDETHDIFHVAWSPDGSRIGYVIQEQVQIGPTPEAGAPDFDLFYYLWVMNADGNDPTQLTFEGREFSFAWSPDGTQIVFERYEPTQHKGTSGGKQIGLATDLYVINADGTGETQLTFDGDAADPAWSPDGTRIAFGGTDDSGTPGIFAMNADGTGRAQLTSGPPEEYDPVWSPDGTKLLYAARDSDLCHIRVMDADGSNVQSLIAAPGSEGCPGQEGMSWGVAQAIATAEPSPSETPTSEPTPTETAEPATDLGLGFPVCNVSSVTGHFGDPTTRGRAFAATKLAEDGSCPDDAKAFNVVAVDFTGDGTAEVSYGPVECDFGCTAFAAPDVDGDGTDEILVQNVHFSIAGLRLFEVGVGGAPGADGPFLIPVEVVPPGDPEGGFEPGTEPQLWLGGDAFEVDALDCRDTPEGRVLVATVAFEEPPNLADSVWKAHETTFALRPVGELHVVGTRNFEEPVTPGGPSFVTSGDLCGAKLPYPFSGD